MLTKLILKGGGEKGIALIGVLRALSETNRLEPIQKIAGTSVGAIGALLFSTGWPAEKIIDRIQNANFSNMVYGKTEFERIINDVKSIEHLFKLGGAFQAQAISVWFESIIKEVTGNAHCTFAQWNQFRLANPHLHLKDIYVEAFNANRSVNETFSFESKYKDVSIAQAVRASMAVPGFFTCEKIWDPEAHMLCEFADGGTRDNYPYDVFESTEKMDFDSFGVWLGEKGEIDYVTKGTLPPAKPIQSGKDYLLSALEGVIGQESRIIRDTKLKDQIIFIDTENITTLEFNAKKSDLDKIIENGYKATKAFLAKHDVSMQNLILTDKPVAVLHQFTELEKPCKANNVPNPSTAEQNDASWRMGCNLV